MPRPKKSEASYQKTGATQTATPSRTLIGQRHRPFGRPVRPHTPVPAPPLARTPPNQRPPHLNDVTGRQWLDPATLGTSLSLHAPDGVGGRAMAAETLPSGRLGWSLCAATTFFFFLARRRWAQGGRAQAGLSFRRRLNGFRAPLRHRQVITELRIERRRWGTDDVSG